MVFFFFFLASRRFLNFRPNPNSRVVGIPDLNFELASLAVLLNVDVDGKVSVDVAHLVLEALGDTDDQIVDDGADGTESSDTLADTVVHLNRDDVLLGATESDGNVGEVLDKLACNTTRRRKSVGVFPGGALAPRN